MFKRKFQALQFPLCDKFNVEDDSKFRYLVAWLEDQKIRHYKIDERVGLRTTKSSEWQTHFAKYLQDLSCPFNINEKVFVLDWLLGFAIRLQYEDENPPSERNGNVSAPKVVQSNPFDRLDFGSSEFKAGVAKIAQLLKVPEHPNHLVTLKAISLLLKSRLSVEAQDKSKNSKSSKEKTASVCLDNTSLGFNTGDQVLDHAVAVLRLLHINELRALQTDINKLIVAAQTYTANPKTDTSLGKVGR